MKLTTKIIIGLIAAGLVGWFINLKCNNGSNMSVSQNNGMVVSDIQDMKTISLDRFRVLVVDARFDGSSGFSRKLLPMSYSHCVLVNADSTEKETVRLVSNDQVSVQTRESGDTLFIDYVGNKNPFMLGWFGTKRSYTQFYLHSGRELTLIASSPAVSVNMSRWSDKDFVLRKLDLRMKGGELEVTNADLKQLTVSGVGSLTLQNSRFGKLDIDAGNELYSGNIRQNEISDFQLTGKRARYFPVGIMHENENRIGKMVWEGVRP